MTTILFCNVLKELNLEQSHRLKVQTERRAERRRPRKDKGGMIEKKKRRKLKESVGPF